MLTNLDKVRALVKEMKTLNDQELNLFYNSVRLERQNRMAKAVINRLDNKEE